MSMTDRPIETGLYTLIGPDDVEVSANDFSATADLTIAATYGDLPRTRLVSGEIQGVLLVASETGTGAVPDEPGWVYFFDVDPNTTSGDTALELVDRQAIIGQVAFAAADWDIDANGATAYKPVAIPFHAVTILYAVFRNLGGAINDNAADNETLQINVWYRRDD